VVLNRSTAVHAVAKNQRFVRFAAVGQQQLHARVRVCVFAEDM
jgi:hypothetical protein